MPQLKSKKPIINLTIPDIAKIGKRTFYIGLAALLLDSIITGIALVIAPDDILDKEFLSMYYTSMKDTLMIILIGKIVAGKGQ